MQQRLDLIIFFDTGTQQHTVAAFTHFHADACRALKNLFGFIGLIFGPLLLKSMFKFTSGAACATPIKPHNADANTTGFIFRSVCVIESRCQYWLQVLVTAAHRVYCNIQV